MMEQNFQPTLVERLVKRAATTNSVSFRQRPESILRYHDLSWVWSNLRMDPGICRDDIVDKGTIPPQPPRSSSPFEGEARWGWGHTHQTIEFNSRETSHG
jgi:hypothetical protein